MHIFASLHIFGIYPHPLTDASRSGISFAMVQEGPPGQKRLITCGSRGLNSAEARYVPVELERLGIVYVIQKCALYIMGAPKPFTVMAKLQTP